MNTTSGELDWGAFVPGPRHEAPATGHGPLDGLRFAVKDLIDTEGVTTGAGNPDWLRTHRPALVDAAVVARLRRAGASVAGRTVTDELAFSLEGENAHFGTPRNPRSPDHLPGGSSSGSAVAVAAGLVDFALGTDTGGSVRIPASFCGLFALRPSHGAVSLEGVVPFAPSYDTVGWFARTASLLAEVGRCLLPPSTQGPLQLHVPADVFALCEPAARAVLEPLAHAIAARLNVTTRGAPGDVMRPAVAGADRLTVFEPSPQAWHDAYATLQGADILASQGAWIEAIQPRFGPAIAPRFASLRDLREDPIAAAREWRAAARLRLSTLLGRDRALLVPTAPGPALRRDANAAVRGLFYQRALALGAIAGHAGLPQVTLPVMQLDGLPLGLSIIGPSGSDLQLLELARRLEHDLPAHGEPPRA